MHIVMTSRRASLAAAVTVFLVVGCTESSHDDSGAEEKTKQDVVNERSPKIRPVSRELEVRERRRASVEKLLRELEWDWDNDRPQIRVTR